MLFREFLFRITFSFFYYKVLSVCLWGQFDSLAKSAHIKKATEGDGKE